MHKGMFRSWFLSGGVLMLLVMALFAACGGDDSSTSSAPAAPAAPAAQEKAEEKEEVKEEKKEVAKPAKKEEVAKPAKKEEKKAPPPPSFKGETVKMVIGFPPGGGFDTSGRLVARHLGKHIPGNPKVLVQNRPGASSAVAINSLYAKNPSDGLTFGYMNWAINLQALLSDEVAKYDPGELQNLAGMAAGDVWFLWVRGDHPAETVEDLLKANGGQPLKHGASGLGSPANTWPRALDAMGIPAQVILGYAGTAAYMLGIERGELDAIVLPLSSALSAFKTQVANGDIKPMLRLNPPNENYGNVDAPQLIDQDWLTADGKAIAAFMIAVNSYLRPMVYPPGVSQDVVDMMRDAFAKLVVDPEFVEESTRAGFTVSYASGAELDEALATMSGASQTLLDTYSGFLTAPPK